MQINIQRRIIKRILLAKWLPNRRVMRTPFIFGKKIIQLTMLKIPKQIKRALILQVHHLVLAKMQPLI